MLTTITYAKSLVDFHDASTSDVGEVSISKEKSERSKDFHCLNHSMKTPDVEKTWEEKF